ncbi:hypothetical protein ACTVR5_12175 [Serratia marcescens]|uniref:hypothetical protein n=1 Tax=Serratia marcescens TaxID=615 RepID=UPI003FA6B2B8
MSYGWLFEKQKGEVSGDVVIDLEHLPPELKLTAIQILVNQIDRETADSRALKHNFHLYSSS